MAYSNELAAKYYKENPVYRETICRNMRKYHAAHKDPSKKKVPDRKTEFVRLKLMPENYDKSLRQLIKHYQKPPHLVAWYNEVMEETIIPKMRAERERLMAEMGKRDLSEQEYKVLATVMDTLHKNISLHEGKATVNIGVMKDYTDEELIALATQDETTGTSGTSEEGVGEEAPA
jgi:hypothetical protein